MTRKMTCVVAFSADLFLGNTGRVNAFQMNPNIDKQYQNEPVQRQGITQNAGLVQVGNHV
jgi:hypothetical protein